MHFSASLIPTQNWTLKLNLNNWTQNSIWPVIFPGTIFFSFFNIRLHSFQKFATLGCTHSIFLLQVNSYIFFQVILQVTSYILFHTLNHKQPHFKRLSLFFTCSNNSFQQTHFKHASLFFTCSNNSFQTVFRTCSTLPKKLFWTNILLLFQLYFFIVHHSFHKAFSNPPPGNQGLPSAWSLHGNQHKDFPVIWG